MPTDIQVVEQLAACPVGTKVWFPGERHGYTVRARSSRYLVCTKPFNLRRTVLYTVIDLDLGIRGTENLVFGFGAETDEQCEEMIQRLTEPDGAGCPTVVSSRNRVPLKLDRLEVPHAG